MLTSVSSSNIFSFHELPFPDFGSLKQMVTVGYSSIGCSILVMELLFEAYKLITLEARIVTKINKMISAVPSRAFFTLVDNFLFEETILSLPLQQLAIPKVKTV